MLRCTAILFLALAASAAYGQEPDASLADKAGALFAATAASTCDDGGGEPEIHPIAFRYSYDAKEDPARTATLFRYFCFAGAYNEIHVYFLADDEGTVAPLHFAEPHYDVRYAGETDETVEEIAILGFTAASQLVNSGYDPATQTITAHPQWRGLGDASSHGVWRFAEGGFRLVRYEVDASYDGEMNPQVLIDYDSAP